MNGPVRLEREAGAAWTEPPPLWGNGPPGLYCLLEPDVLADPYLLYRQLREHAPVLWDPYLSAWVVTSHAEIVTVLNRFSAARAPAPQQLRVQGLDALAPIAEIMSRQMLFLDAPAHTRLRGLCSALFLPRRIERLEARIQEIADGLLDHVVGAGRLDVIADFAAPLPAIVTAELLGLPSGDHLQLKAWSADFAEMLGNFQHNPDRAASILRSVSDMVAYFRAVLDAKRAGGGDGLIKALLTAEVDGVGLTEDEVIANLIVTMVGGQETTTNLIGNGLLTLLRHTGRMAELRAHPALIAQAVEELLRYESPSQHTARLAPDDIELGGKRIRKRDAVIAVMAAGNRDPLRFVDPDRLDFHRADNRHLAFGWAAHFCFGAPLARMEGRIAFATLLRRLPDMVGEAGELHWRENLGLRGLTALNVRFGALHP